MMHFPHEGPELLGAHAPGERPWRGDWGRQNARLAAAIVAYLRALNLGGSMARVCARFHELCVGPAGAQELAWKSSFSARVRALGYRAPLTLVVPAGSARASIEVQLADAFAPDAALFCKPLDGFQGRGAREQPDRASAAAFLAGRRVTYLAQSLERPQQDWRYVLHRDRAWLEHAGHGRVWRIAYEKVRPSVCGDGRASVEELLRASHEVPATARARLMRHLDAGARARVPAVGESVTLVATGNITQGAYGRLPTPPELHVLDTFMARFQSDLDAHLDAPLATACFDLGLTDVTVLSRPYDFDAVRRALVFYEFQFPFGLSGYCAALPLPPALGVARLLPGSLWRGLWTRYLTLRFFASVTHSGRARRPPSVAT